MGIPRFYKWLKNRYPLIRIDLSDKQKQLPIIDHFYIDFNALVYQCIRESNCFLRNKIKPFTFEQIYERVFDYLMGLIYIVNPQDLIYIALDGVAPRAKINQSRDRRFKGSKEDQMFEKIIEQIGIENKQNFLQNSISPGTQFLNDLCAHLKEKIIEQLQQNWKNLKIFFSDCCVPGEGEHKIMEFMRYIRNYKIFSQKTTYCVYSPDADVILLTLSLGLQNICLIKQDTSINPSPNWTATSVYRKSQPKQFEFVMINILREYFEKEFSDILKIIPGSNIQQILDDLILLMAFVGNDFLPLEFCFTLKDNHIENLFASYKTYLEQNKQFINIRGKIDWSKICKLLEIGKKFQAHMIEQMLNKRRQKGPRRLPEQIVDVNMKKNGNEDDLNGSDAQEYAAIQNFQVQNHTITKGRDKYYETRFEITDINSDQKYINIIESYIKGLEFYCEYYYLGLPSWTWYYPYHYTPMLTDVYEYLNNHKVNTSFSKSEPFQPILALMFMVSLKSVQLLPIPLQNLIKDQKNQLRTPINYFPTNFLLDKFETLKYNKRALIQFLDQKQVRRVYQTVTKDQYTVEELKRNEHRNIVLLYYNPKSKEQNKVQQKEIILNLLANLSQQDLKVQKQVQKILKSLFTAENKSKQNITKQRFPTLKTWWGANFQYCNTKILTKNKYRYNGNPGEIVWFNNFLGMIQDLDNTNLQLRRAIEAQYLKMGVNGTCEFYFTIKRVNYIRQLNRFCLMNTKKEVIVPDFAIIKSPNFDYIRKTENYPFEEQYQVGEIVSILNTKYFGYQGFIQKISNKTAQIHLVKAPIIFQQKIEQCTFFLIILNLVDEQFYTVEYVLDHLNIQYETLISIMNEIIILPQFNRKKEPAIQLLPTQINFSLNIIDIRKRLIVPRFVRCQVENHNSRKPTQIFKKMEISKSCLVNLEKYVQKFDWLVQYIEDQIQKKNYHFGKQLYARIIFSEFTNPNLKMYKEFLKLYEFDIEGYFYSIYSKIAQPQMPKFKVISLPQKAEDRVITVNNYEIISKKQARKAPPALKHEPEYHNIGDKVILLSNLQVGYIHGIDDNIIHIRVGTKQKHYRVKFHEIFNQNWPRFLCVEEGKGWNLQSSYYSPSYWNKAIGLDKSKKSPMKKNKLQKIEEKPIPKQTKYNYNEVQNEQNWQDISSDCD